MAGRSLRPEQGQRLAAEPNAIGVSREGVPCRHEPEDWPAPLPPPRAPGGRKPKTLPRGGKSPPGAAEPLRKKTPGFPGKSRQRRTHYEENQKHSFSVSRPDGAACGGGAERMRQAGEDPADRRSGPDDRLCGSDDRRGSPRDHDSRPGRTDRAGRRRVHLLSGRDQV